MKLSRSFAASPALSTALAGVVPHAAGQEAGAADDVIVLDPIYITGLKGEDIVKELPASVTVIPGNSQTADAIDPGAAITRAAPNFYFGGFAQPGADFVNMRGIGPLGQPSNSLDNSFGFATNGADQRLRLSAIPARRRAHRGRSRTAGNAVRPQRAGRHRQCHHPPGGRRARIQAAWRSRHGRPLYGGSHRRRLAAGECAGRPRSGADISLTEDTDNIFSQEFRLNSTEGDWLKWVAGVTYFRSAFDSQRDQLSSYSPYSSGLFDARITSDTVAAFGEVTVPVTDALKISGGLRVAHDRQSLDVTYTGNGFPGSVAGHAQDDDISDTYLTGRLAATYDWTEQFMTYASVSRGYASRGFDRYTLNAAAGSDAVPFRPSSGWTYEVGAKADALDGRLTFGASVFYNDIRDGQLVGYNTSTTPVTFQFVNQDYSSYGFELEVQAEVLPDLVLGAGVGMTKSRLGDVTETAALGAKEGNQVPNSPEFTATVSASYRFLEDFQISAQYQYVGKRTLDLANTGDLPAYHMLNARIGWTKESWEIYGFANNLLDERPLYFGATYSPTAHAVNVGPGRSLGLGMSKTF